MAAVIAVAVAVAGAVEGVENKLNIASARFVNTLLLQGVARLLSRAVVITRHYVVTYGIVNSLSSMLAPSKNN